jgi:hypothetical protein
MQCGAAMLQRIQMLRRIISTCGRLTAALNRRAQSRCASHAGHLTGQNLSIDGVFNGAFWTRPV